MTVSLAIKERRSIRKFKDMPIEEEKLRKVLEAARLAPSAINRQDWRFIVIRDLDIKKGLSESTPYSFIGDAPVIIAACGTNPDSIMSCGQPRYTVDLSIATSFMLLQAHELGLGTCWIGGFDEEKVKEVLGIPEGVRVVALTPLGYPDESPSQRPRKEIDEIISYDKY